MKKAMHIYLQIENYLDELIKSNQHIEDYKLPSENELAEKFDASRITVRKALNNMKDQGKIIRMQGKGSFANFSMDSSAAERTDMIYLLLPDIERHYSREVINGAHEFFAENGISLSIAMTGNDPAAEEAKIRSILGRHCRGIILFPVIHMTYHEELLKLALANYPIIIVGNSLPGMNFSSVHCDYYKQLYETVSRLFEEGHKNISYISENSENSSTYKERLRGYSDSITERAGVKAIKCLELEFYPETHQSVSRESVETVIHSFLRDNPEVTALITTDLALEYVLSYIDGEGSGRDLRLVIIDGPEYMGMIKDRNAIIINQNPRMIGRLAAEQLYGQIRGKASPREIITEYTKIEL